MPYGFPPWGDLSKKNSFWRTYAIAVSPRLTPLELDKTNETAVFRDRNGVFQTTLSSCECPTFQEAKNKKPCEHIVRLALECGLIRGSFKTDPLKIEKTGAPDRQDEYLRECVKFLVEHREGMAFFILALYGDDVFDSFFWKEEVFNDEYVKAGMLIYRPDGYTFQSIDKLLGVFSSITHEQMPSTDRARKNLFFRRFDEILSALGPEYFIVNRPNGQRWIAQYADVWTILGEKPCLCSRRLKSFFDIYYWKDEKPKSSIPIVHELLMEYDEEYRSHRKQSITHSAPLSKSPSLKTTSTPDKTSFNPVPSEEPAIMTSKFFISMIVFVLVLVLIIYALANI